MFMGEKHFCRSRTGLILQQCSNAKKAYDKHNEVFRGRVQSSMEKSGVPLRPDFAQIKHLYPVSNLARAALKADVFAFKDETNQSMAHIGRRTGADRVCALMMKRGKKQPSGWYEWCEEGIPSAVREMAAQLKGKLACWLALMPKNTVVSFGNTMRDIGAYPPEWAEPIMRFGIASLAVVSVRRSDAAGLIAFQAVVRYQSWDDVCIKRIEMFADALAGAYAHHMQQVALLELLA